MAVASLVLGCSTPPVVRPERAPEPDVERPAGPPFPRIANCYDAACAFDGGISVVNPTAYDVRVKTDGLALDVSADKIAREFVVPSMDGRLLVSTEDAERPGNLPDPSPSFTRDGPVRLVERDGKIMMRLDNGWRAHFRSDGTLAALDDGKASVPVGIRAVIVSSAAWRNFGTEMAKHVARPIILPLPA